MSERNHNPLAYLAQAYEELKPALRFSATNVQDWRLWRDALRAKVIELLGGFPDRRCDLEPEVVEKVQMEGYRREKITIRSEPGYRVPLYVLVPDGIEGPSPTVVALHGHGAGVMEICGIALSETMEEHIRVHNYDYAVQAVKHGYVVIAPDQRGFGACRAPEDVAADPFRSSCRQMSFNAMMMGKTAIGMRVWDVMRCIDYAEIREESDADRIACMGLSGGGTVTLFSSALEERIKVAIVSGYFNTFRDCIMAMSHCECNYVPGILRYGEMYDVAGLIAPRPLLIESGTEDSIFPVAATEYAFEQVKRVYDLLDVPERLDKDIFEGAHRFSGRKAFDWLKRWLMSNEE